jgi:hypothetical protein
MPHDTLPEPDAEVAVVIDVARLREQREWLRRQPKTPEQQGLVLLLDAMLAEAAHIG